MSRNGSGVYSLPPGSVIANGDTSDATDINTPLLDIEADLNATRPVSSGGTGAVSASGARTAFGLVIGTDVQAYDAGLASIAGLTTESNRMIYTTGSDTYAVTEFSAFARTLNDDADAATARTTLGLGTSATLASVDEDTMVSDSATLLPSQQSVKAYADAIADANPIAAWITFDGNPTVTTKRNSGFANMTRISAGIYEATLSSAQPTTSYGVLVTAGDASTIRLAAHYYIISTTVFRIYVINHGNGAFSDADFVTATVLY